MHNIKEIRKDFNVFAKSLEKRSVNVDFKNLQKLDEQNRELIQKKEALEKEKKDISKSKDESMFKRSKEISLDLEKISENQKNVKSELDNILSNIPNIPHSDVPNGKDENDNIEISKSGKIPDFDFKPKSHYGPTRQMCNRPSIGRAKPPASSPPQKSARDRVRFQTSKLGTSSS